MLGTVAVILVGELMVNLAEAVPSSTPVAPPKFEPVIVTCWPTYPEAGETPANAGGCGTVSEDELVAVPLGVVTLIRPVVAPVGTWALMSIDEFTTKLESDLPLNVTLVAPVKPLPWMSTLVPTGPLAGANEPIVGGGTVNGEELVAVPLGVVTEIGPVVAPSGT